MIFKIVFLCTSFNLVLCIENINSTVIDSTNNKNQHHLENKSDNNGDKGTVLEYKPTRPGYVPKPVTVHQSIPPGKQSPSSPEEYITATIECTTSDNKLVLAYKPTRPWYVPDPVTVPQLIPPGKPWPASPEDVNKTTLSPPLTASTDQNQQESTSLDTDSKIVLGYKPTRPSYVPDPVTIPQLIPPGKPWPASPGEYANRSTFSPHLTTGTDQELTPLANKLENDTDNKIVLGYKPTRPSFVPDPVTIPQLIPPGKPWPASPEEYLNRTTLSPPLTAGTDQESTSLENKIQKETDSKIVLGYKPTRPWYVPDPVTIPQLIPPGKPWPASPEEYANRSTLSSHLAVSTDQNQQENKIEKETDSKIVLEYKPTRPWYVPDPVTIPQLIPPGKPWPASPESPHLINRFPEITASTNTNQQEATTANSTSAAVTKSTLSPHLINRFPELTSTTASTKGSTPSTRIVLGYQPQRPFYLPEPVTIGQIIPPGKPWPASLEEYATFSQITYRPNKFKNKIA